MADSERAEANKELQTKSKALECMNLFPWTHPDIFTSLLINTCNTRTILATRAVCHDWKNWMDRNGKLLWAKYLKARRKSFYLDVQSTSASHFDKHLAMYRALSLRSIDPFECDDKAKTCLQSMLTAIRIEKTIRQLKESLHPRISNETYRHMTEVRQLPGAIKSMGPISLFIRLKVRNPLVERILTEVLNKQLAGIVVDKAQVRNKTLQMYILPTMQRGQAWIFRFFNQEEVNTSAVGRVQAEVFSSEEEVARAYPNGPGLPNSASALNDNAAASESTASATGDDRCLKRKNLPDENENSPKRAKLDDRNLDEEEINAEAPSMFADIAIKAKNNHFPTILELLDIDHPEITRILVEKCQADRTLVIPSLEDFVLNQEKYSGLIHKDFEVIGRDQDGNISKINPANDIKSSDTAIVGYFSNIVNYVHSESDVVFWGGKDIRGRWGKFSEHLEAAENQDTQKSVEKNQPGLGITFTSSSTSSIPAHFESVESVEALLAARGISVTRK